MKVILRIVANFLKDRVVILRYYPLTNEYKLPHKHFIISPAYAVLKLQISIQQTIILLKNSKHYDGLIFKDNFYFSFFQRFQINHMQTFRVHNISPEPSPYKRYYRL